MAGLTATFTLVETSRCGHPDRSAVSNTASWCARPGRFSASISPAAQPPTMRPEANQLNKLAGGNLEPAGSYTVLAAAVGLETGRSEGGPACAIS